MVETVIDVNANRLREALRCVEEYFRHIERIPDVCRELCRIRRSVSSLLPEDAILNARYSETDPGRERYQDTGCNLTKLLTANFKRAQEAGRVLEEYSRVACPEKSREWQKLRFRIYDIEARVFARTRLDGRLYLIITPEYCCRAPEETALCACRAGVEIIQYRDPHRTDRQKVRTAREIRKITRDYGVLFIVNDRPDLVVLSEADGLHLGQDDIKPGDARAVIGTSSIIGVSTHSLEQLASLKGADYAALGPVFSCVSKEKEEEIVGISPLSKKKVSQCPLPLFLVGGLNMDNYGKIMTLGFSRLVFMTALTMNPEMETEIGRILEARRKFDDNNTRTQKTA